MPFSFDVWRETIRRSRSRQSTRDAACRPMRSRSVDGERDHHRTDRGPDRAGPGRAVVTLTVPQGRSRLTHDERLPATAPSTSRLTSRQGSSACRYHVAACMRDACSIPLKTYWGSCLIGLVTPTNRSH